MKDKPTLRHGFGRAYWVMMVFCFACVIAGAVVGFFGPDLFPTKPHATTASPQLGKPASAR